MDRSSSFLFIFTEYLMTSVSELYKTEDLKSFSWNIVEKVPRLEVAVDLLNIFQIDLAEEVTHKSPNRQQI